MMAQAGTDLLLQAQAAAQRARESFPAGTVAGWHSTTVATAPDLAGLVRAAVPADGRAGASRAQFGAGLGITAQAARSRFGRTRGSSSVGAR